MSKDMEIKFNIFFKNSEKSCQIVKSQLKQKQSRLLIQFKPQDL